MSTQYLALRKDDTHYTWVMFEENVYEQLCTRSGCARNLLETIETIAETCPRTGITGINIVESEIDDETWEALTTYMDATYPHLRFIREVEASPLIKVTLHSVLTLDVYTPLTLRDIMEALPYNEHDKLWSRNLLKKAVKLDPFFLEKEAKINGDVVVYATDASQIDGYTTAAYVSSEKEYGSVELRLKGATVLQGEIKAVVMALNSARQYFSAGRKVIILTDSREAMVYARRGLIPNMDAESQKLFQIFWQRGHVGHPLNECADLLAKMQHRSQKSGNETLCRKIVERQLQLWPEFMEKYGVIHNPPRLRENTTA